jgi:hypothetical protein
MKNHKLTKFIAFALALFVLAGCEKDEEAPEQTYKAPEVASQTTIIEAPTGLQTSADPKVAMVSSYITMVNAFANMPAMFSSLPQTATNDGLKSSTSSWTWTDGQGNSIWIDFSESTVENIWEYYIQTADMTSRFLWCKATELKTKLGGSFIAYARVLDSPSMTYTWAKTAEGTVTATILLDYGIAGAYFFDVTANSDNSGSMKVYEGSSSAGTKFIDITWDSAGHGSYWVKDLDSGETTSATF